MEQDTIRISRDPLFEFAREVFSRVGMSPENATTEAEVLLWASQRGVDSHGVQLISTYVGNVEKGYMNPKPNIQIIQETAATLFVEAGAGTGKTRALVDRIVSLVVSGIPVEPIAARDADLPTG